MVVLSDFLSCNIFKALYLKINVGMGKNHHIINWNYPHHFSSSILCHIVFGSFYTVLRLCALLGCILPFAPGCCIRFSAPGRCVLLLPYMALLYRLRRYGIMPFGRSALRYFARRIFVLQSFALQNLALGLFVP